jgi:uncharacterized protein
MQKNTEIVYDFVKSELEWVCSAHDLFHIDRVYKLSKQIYEFEKKWDKEVILYSALLHEILDDKFFKDDIEKQKNKILKLLERLNLKEEQISKIFYIVNNIWYWKSLGKEKIEKNIEFKIVEDADRLESLGAISIARTFAYWGRKWIPIYDPNIEVDLNLTKEKYWSSSWTSINHFYEKLLKLKDLMNTEIWKKIAKERHEFLEIFLKQFFKEWNAEI